MAQAPLVIEAAEGDARELVLGELERELEGTGLNVDAGLATLRELCRDAVLFEVREGNQVVMRYALATRERPGGREGLILAASGAAPGHDLTAEVVPVMERQFIDVAAVTTYTLRPGLVAKMAQQGYRRFYGLRKILPRGRAC